MIVGGGVDNLGTKKGEERSTDLCQKKDILDRLRKRGKRSMSRICRNAM